MWAPVLVVHSVTCAVRQRPFTEAHTAKAFSMVPFSTTLRTLARPSWLVSPAPSRKQDHGRCSSLPLHADKYHVYRAVGNAMAISILFVVLTEFVNNALHPIDRDFISFWGAGRLALEGAPSAAYDRSVLLTVQLTAATFDGGEMPFAYPPAFLLLLAPFALLPFPVAMTAWTVATFAAYLAAAKRMFPASGWLAAAFPPVLVNAVLGQSAFMIAGLFIGGLLLLPRRPFLAGLLLGCLAVKPQLGLLLPLALLAGGQWRAIAGAAISSTGVLILGAMALGWSATWAWLAQLPLYASIAQEGLVGWHKLASVYASMRQTGMGADTAFTIHVAVALLAAGAVWRVWRQPAIDARAKAAILASGTMLISPYLFLYDALILVVPFLWLGKRQIRPALLSLLWCVPLVTIAQTYGFNGPVNLNPLIALGLLALVYREVHARFSQPAVVAATA